MNEINDNEGDTYLVEGKYLEAIRWYDNALSSSVNNKQLWLNKGVARVTLGVELDSTEEVREGMVCFDKVIALDRNCVPAWINKAFALLFLDENKKALRCFRKGLEILPHASAIDIPMFMGTTAVFMRPNLLWVGGDDYMLLSEHIQHFLGTLQNKEQIAAPRRFSLFSKNDIDLVRENNVEREPESVFSGGWCWPF